MTRNQLHGKKFEDWIKACGRFPGSADAARSQTAPFDIEARFDREFGLPTSIKATGNRTIGLSDARGFWGIDQTIRMIVGTYRQAADRKTFFAIHEFILTAEALRNLRGHLSVVEVAELHQGISTNQFAAGDYKAARLWAKSQKKSLSHRMGKVVLNPKIDSKSQRRFQCSVSLTALIEQTTPTEAYCCHTERMGEFALPVDLFSTRREFS
jgi:isochorismate synthase EntC